MKLGTSIYTLYEIVLVICMCYRSFERGETIMKCDASRVDLVACQSVFCLYEFVYPSSVRYMLLVILA